MCRPVKLDSQKLKNNFLGVYKKDTLFNLAKVKIKKDYLKGYQAHHIIPVEVIKEYVEESEYEFYNQDWNCLMVAEYGDAIIHSGSHPRYNEFVEKFIAMLFEVFSETSFAEIAVGIATIIREDFNDALTKERLQHTRDMSMDTFAENYLWDVYC